MISNPVFREQPIDAAATLLEIAVAEVLAVADRSALTEDLAHRTERLGCLAGS